MAPSNFMMFKLPQGSVEYLNYQWGLRRTVYAAWWIDWLSGVPDYFGRNKISSGGDLSHYSSASLY